MNKARAKPPKPTDMEATRDFSLVQGGPLFQMLRRSRLTDDAMELLHRRIVAFALMAWLPLLVLSAVDGHLLGDSVAIPFLRDWEVHVKFLVALPLLVATELTAHRRLRFTVQQFQERNLVPDNARTRFEAAVASAYRLRNSKLAEVILMALVYGVGVLVVWRQYVALDVLTWYGTPSDQGRTLTLAGTWYGYVSLPIFQFLLIRWYFRLLIWMRFLWQVSRIKLQLMPTHPDATGGLGFLSRSAEAFVLLATAHGALLAGQLANRIFYSGATLTDFKLECGLLVAFLLIMLLGPLFVFTPQLEKTWRDGGREYGSLAHRYVREFDTKWLRGGAPPGEELIGSGDIQSLADIGASFERVQGMRLWPFGRTAVMMVVVATLVPLTPLLLTMMPLAELAKKLFGILF